MTSGLKKTRLTLYQKQQGLCFWCGRKLILPVSGNADQRVNTATMDHLIPKSKGGSNRSGNFVVACPGCNRSRGCQYVNPSNNEPLFLVTTNLLTPDLPGNGFKLRDFILIDYHETPTF